MNQVIVISSDEKFRTLVEKECEKYADLFPVFFHTLSELECFLEQLMEAETVIIDAGPCRASELQILRNNRFRFQHTVLYSPTGSCEVEDIRELKDWAEPCTYLSARAKGRKDQSNRFVGLPLETLVHFEALPFPLFLNLSSENFVKRFPAFENIDFSTVEKYLERGVKEFWFERSYFRDFNHLLMSQLMNRLVMDYTSVRDREFVTSEVYNTVREIVNNMGVDSKVTQLCETLMGHVAKSVSKDAGSDLLKYLDDLRTRPELGFNYRLVLLTSFIAGKILPEEKKANLEDIIFASFFADMSLQKAEHIHYRTKKDLLILPEEERIEICTHASSSASLISGSSSSTPLRAKLIREHHGDPEGSDLPDSVHPDVEDLSRYLFVAQEIAYSLLVHPQTRVWKICQDLISIHKGSVVEEIFVKFEKEVIAREKAEEPA